MKSRYNEIIVINRTNARRISTRRLNNMCKNVDCDECILDIKTRYSCALKCTGIDIDLFDNISNTLKFTKT